MELGERRAIDDEQKDVAIIEASALLVTLIFIVLSFYSSNYAMYYTTWEQQCGSNLKGCVWPPWLGEFSALVGTLEPITYATGFFFVVAALVAAIRLLVLLSAWILAGLRNIEFFFFLAGLIFLAVIFFPRALADFSKVVILSVMTVGMIVGPLWWAHHRRHVIEAGGSA